jgi:hypothetical protein
MTARDIERLFLAPHIGRRFEICLNEIRSAGRAESRRAVMSAHLVVYIISAAHKAARQIAAGLRIVGSVSFASEAFASCGSLMTVAVEEKAALDRHDLCHLRGSAGRQYKRVRVSGRARAKARR